MKKTICILITLCLLISFIPATAADGDKMKDILLSVKERIHDTDSFENFNSRISNYNGKTVYNFEWYTDSEEGFSSMNISVTDSGIITSYSRHSSSEENTKSNAFNRKSHDEVIHKAKEFSKMLNPGISDSITVEKMSETENLFDSQYRFKLTRIENGIPVSQNNGYITLDSNAENIVSYSINYTEDATFTPADSIINKEEAVSAYKSKLGFELKYFFTYDGRVKKAFPAYVPSENENTYINAVTGEIISITHTEENRKEYAGGTTSNQIFGTMNDALSKPETDEIENIKGLLSEDELLDIISSNKYLTTDKDMKQSSFIIHKDYYDSSRYYATVDFRTEGDKYAYASYTLDAVTGEITNYRYNSDIPYDAKAKEDEAYEDFDKAVSEISGNKFKEYKESSKDNFSKQYERYVNGIPTEDYIAVSYDSYNKRINRYNISYSEIDFPDISKVKTADEITDIIFNQIDYHPCYIINGKKAEIVYITDSPITVRIDPETGNLMNYNGEKYEWNKPLSYNDIEGHWAQKYITELAVFKIGFKEDSFNPDKPITKGDYIALLTSAIISNQPITLKDGYDNSAEISLAVRHGIIGAKEERDENLTRKDAAVYMIRALGIEKYAKLDVYKKIYPDVTDGNGHIALLSGMGILNGDSSGKFNPEGILTRAQAMVIIHNYLSLQ